MFGELTSTSTIRVRRFLRLAPASFSTYRSDRFTGESARASLTEFSEQDVRRIRLVYSDIQELMAALDGHRDDLGHVARILTEFQPRHEEFIHNARTLGAETRAEEQPAHLARALHDVRGGALQAFVLRWEMFTLLPDESKALAGIYYLLRDHAKIMRNCVFDLDPERFGADTRRKEHRARLLLEKWSGADFYASRTPVRIDFRCSYEGPLCVSCMEFSTLDRVIYNLVSNAAKFADDGQVRFEILPIPDIDHPENLRFVVANHVSPAQRATLTSALPELGKVFKGGFTTGGHGIGASIVADFCARAYGLTDIELARKQGYFGASWIDDSFVAWFHWPVPRG